MHDQGCYFLGAKPQSRMPGKMPFLNLKLYVNICNIRGDNMDTVLIFIVLILSAINLILFLSIKSKINNNDSKHQLSLIESSNERVEKAVKDEVARFREENKSSDREMRIEIANNQNANGKSILDQMSTIATMQKNQLDTFSNQLIQLTSSNEQRLNEMRNTIEEKLSLIQKENSTKLEEMRATVDEKLHSTLEKRLGESFGDISKRLENLYKELGEMHSLASGVNDLKRTLTSVKTRGIWGEIQLGTLMDEILTADQYETNVITKKKSNDRVEFAIKLPGNDANNTRVYLPIDAKFPQEDYQKLIDAADLGDKNAVDAARKSLELRVKSEAKDIKEKYLDPPNTTDFGIMFLPTESLYAEVTKLPGLIEVLQRDYKVIITGPTTLVALLNSLQMGFRTLAIEKRSSEIWTLLGAVKTQFGKFGEILDKTQKKLREATNTIEDASRKTRTIESKLKKVQELPIEESTLYLQDEFENDIAAATE
jgi:DNA recombination protein RmuC